MTARTAVVVLAAGASTRLGRPKQILLFRGEPLLRRAARLARCVASGPVVVVLGARSDEVRAGLAPLGGVRVVVASSWEKGPGASLKAGLAALAGELVDQLLVLLVDQPAIEAAHLRHLVALGAPAACGYSGVVGVPALFPRAWFDELARLDDASGARAVLLAHQAEVAVFPLAEAGFDVDTQADWTAVSTA